MRDTSYRNPQTDKPWCGFSKKTKHISSVIEPSGFNATAPPQIKILLNSLFGWSQGASQPQILQRRPGIEPTRINVRRDVYFVFCWKHWPRRVRLRISIRCVAHELKSILMRRANSQYVCMYVCYIIVQGSGSDSLWKAFSIWTIIQIFEICEGGYFQKP